MRPTSAAQWENAHACTVTASPTAYRDAIFVIIIKCGHYTRAAHIYLNKLYVRLLFNMRLLFEGGYYSRVATIRVNTVSTVENSYKTCASTNILNPRKRLAIRCVCVCVTVYNMSQAHHMGTVGNLISVVLFFSRVLRIA